MILGERDEAIIRPLTKKIRLISRPQLVANFWPAGNSGRRNAERRIAELVAADLLLRIEVVSNPLLTLEGPVVAWRPGRSRPNFASISTYVSARWTPRLEIMTAYLAGSKAVGLFGGHFRREIKNRFQATHDLHVTAVYLWYLRTHPTLAATWVGEDVLAPSRKNQKLPDAILCDEAGSPRLVVEFGGRYSKKRLEAFHDDCEARGLPYEIW